MILQGDVFEVLPTLESESVQMCVTSPPYWGLRDYGVEGQLGLEETPEAFVETMVAVFREVRRVLKGDGTLWVNMGDSYVSGQGGRQSACGELPPSIRRDRPEPKARPELENAPSGWAERAVTPRTYPGRESGLKPKDLYGMPWRLAFALQADGWYLRQDIIWHKPNPMPESVKDRCTKAHEYVFLLSKSARYYFDADAIREPFADDSLARVKRGRSDKHKWADGGPGDQTLAKDISQACGNPKGANKRSVWTIATKSYKEAHFATFPPKLIEPCILAGSRPGDVVLDPFLGSGTVGEVCDGLGRSWVGIELNEEYVRLAEKRTAQCVLL